MSQNNTYAFNILVLRNYFRETFGDHYPYEVVDVIMVTINHLKISEMKIYLKNAVNKLSFVSKNIFQVTEWSSCIELSDVISNYYPTILAANIKLENGLAKSMANVILDGRDNLEEWDAAAHNMITVMNKRWFCQIIDDVGSEGPLYDLLKAIYPLIIIPPAHLECTSFIDFISTDSSCQLRFK